MSQDQGFGGITEDPTEAVSRRQRHEETSGIPAPRDADRDRNHDSHLESEDQAVRSGIQLLLHPAGTICTAAALVYLQGPSARERLLL